MLTLPFGRKGSTKLLFYAESPVKYAMFRPVHDRLKRDPRFDLFFAGTMRGMASSRQMARTLGITDLKILRRGLAVHGRFDLVLTADYDIWKPFENRRYPIHASPKVQIFHGVSVRNGAIQDKINRFDHLFTVGPYIDRLFRENELFVAEDPRLHAVGMPKTDRLLDGSLDRAEIARELRLDPSLPTVTLAPTWIPRTPMNRYGIELLRGLASGPWNLLVKLHDKFFDPRYNTVDWRRRLGPLEREFPRMRWIRSFDGTRTLFASDLLISDVSSISNEFALLDRPIVYLGIEDMERLLRQYPKLDLETWGQRAGEIVFEPDDCVAAVTRSLADPEHRGEIRRAMAKDLFYNRGRAAIAATEQIYALVGLDPDPAALQD